MAVRKNFMSILLRMEPNTRKPVLVGRARVWVDRELDSSFTVAVPGSEPCHYGRAYEAALHLRAIADTNR